MRQICVVLALALAASLIFFISQAFADEALIQNGSKVSFDYVLTVDGKVEDSSQARGPLEYVQGGGTLISGLTKQMEGMKTGEEKVIEVKPEEAYGNPDPAKIRELPLSSVPPEVKPEVGMVLEMLDADNRPFPAKIIEVKQDSIVIDLNHPLAGKALTFKVKVVSVA